MAIPPGSHADPLDHLTPTRTSTRPPHPLHPAPCPYRTQDAHFPIRLSNIIRVLPILVVKTHHRAPALACSSTNLYCLSSGRTWTHHWLFTVRHLHLILYAGKGNGRRPLNISAVAARANTAIRRTQATQATQVTQVTQMTQMTQTSLGMHQGPGKRKVTYGTDNLSSRRVHQ